MPDSVLDTSAAPTLINEDQGFHRILRAIRDGTVICSVNLAETASYLNERGRPFDELHRILRVHTIDIVPFDTDLAYRAAEMRRRTRSEGLSLADRACLALAASHGMTAITSDKAWSRVRVGAKVLVFR